MWMRRVSGESLESPQRSRVDVAVWHARSHGIPQERRSKKVSQHSVEVGAAVSARTGALGRRPYGRIQVHAWMSTAQPCEKERERETLLM